MPYKKIILVFSLMAHLLITVPASLIVLTNESIQFELYQHILAPQLGKPEIVFIGDSLTRQGGIWAFRLGRYNFNIWNYGIPGFTTRQLQYNARKIADMRNTRYAFVMAGINDFDKTTKGAEQSFEDYKVIIDTLLDNKITPIVQLTLYRENEKNIRFIDHLNMLVSRYSKKHGITVLDLNPDLAPAKSLLPQYSRDGVHLTEAAYQVWSEAIKKVLVKLESQEYPANIHRD